MVNVYKSQKGMESVLGSYDELLKIWDTAFIEEDVNTTFGKTHCILTGEMNKPPLLLFHGVGDNSAIMWALNIKELSKHFFCIAVDTLGGPGKSIPNQNYNKKTFSQQTWINEIVDYYRLENFSIAGVSNGATMAFCYAVKENIRINKVICMEGGMVIRPIKAIFSTLGMMFPEILLPTRNNMIRIIKKLSSPNSKIYEKYPEIVEHLILLMKNHNQQAMFVHKLDKYDKEKSIASRKKFYFLLGDHNIEHKKEFIGTIKDGGFKYKIIKDAGHGVNHEQPEVINKEIVNHLTSKS